MIRNVKREYKKKKGKQQLTQTVSSAYQEQVFQKCHKEIEN